MWYRHDTPTVMDGAVVRYVTGDNPGALEINASRNGVSGDGLPLLSSREQFDAFVAMLERAWQAHLHIKTNDLQSDRWPLPEPDIGRVDTEGVFGPKKFVEPMTALQSKAGG